MDRDTPFEEALWETAVWFTFFMMITAFIVERL